MPRGVFKTKPTGRPEKEISWQQFEDLCGLHCTQDEIASFMRINVDTLRDRVEKQYGEPYSIVYKRFMENGKCSLRRDQRVIGRTNPAMAIWLGKQWLGQRDITPELEIDPQMFSQFTALMNQLDLMQSARTIEDKSNNAE
jgi:hypothetical protein